MAACSENSDWLTSAKKNGPNVYKYKNEQPLMIDIYYKMENPKKEKRESNVATTNSF